MTNSLKSSDLWSEVRVRGLGGLGIWLLGPTLSPDLYDGERSISQNSEGGTKNWRRKLVGRLDIHTQADVTC